MKLCYNVYDLTFSLHIGVYKVEGDCGSPKMTEDGDTISLRK